MLELSNVKAENTRIPSLEEQMKNLNSAALTLNKEKRDLCDLVSSLRDQINEGEEERSNAKHDETLMREKLKYAIRERDIMAAKVKGLEGMYESELGEIKRAEDIVQSLKQAQMEAEYLKKDHSILRKEKTELMSIIQGLKKQLNIVEEQRDHFENEQDRANQELQLVVSDQQSANNSQRQSQHHINPYPEEIEGFRSRIHALEREKISLEQENLEMQERLDDTLKKLYSLESGTIHSAGLKHDEMKNIEDMAILETLKKLIRQENEIPQSQNIG